MESRINNYGKEYIIDYYWNTDVVYANVYYINPNNPNHKKSVGNLVAYFDNRQTIESTKPHWSVLCFIYPEYIDESLADVIGDELLKNTNCKEPFSVSIYGKNVSNAKNKMWGNIWLE